MLARGRNTCEEAPHWLKIQVNVQKEFKQLQSFQSHINDIAWYNSPAMEIDRRFMNGLSRQQWLQAALALQLALTMEDKDLIHRKLEELNDISRPYAERVMDQAVSGAMKGKSI